MSQPFTNQVKCFKPASSASLVLTHMFSSLMYKPFPLSPLSLLSLFFPLHHSTSISCLFYLSTFIKLGYGYDWVLSHCSFFSFLFTILPFSPFSPYLKSFFFIKKFGFADCMQVVVVIDLFPIKPLQGSQLKTLWRIKTTDEKKGGGGERTDHLPICDQTKLYLKNGIQIYRPGISFVQ